MDFSETSHMPDPLYSEGNAHKNWVKFKQEFTDYLVSIKFDGEPSRVKAAKLRNLIGDFGRGKIVELTLENSDDYDDMIQKLDNWAESQNSSTYERLEFNNRVQAQGEDFESFLGDVRCLIKKCNYGNLTDELLRDKVVTGVWSPKLRRIFRANSNVSLEDAIHMCRMAHLPEPELLQLLAWKREEKATNNSGVVVNKDASDDSSPRKKRKISPRTIASNNCVEAPSSHSSTANELNPPVNELTDTSANLQKNHNRASLDIDGKMNGDVIMPSCSSQDSKMVKVDECIRTDSTSRKNQQCAPTNTSRRINGKLIGPSCSSQSVDIVQVEQTDTSSSLQENNSCASTSASRTMNGELLNAGSSSQDAEMVQDKACSEGTFRFTVDNVSKLKERWLSSPFYVRNLPWRILVIQRIQERAPGKTLKSLGIFLQCNGESENRSWRCVAGAELKVLPQREGVEPISKEIQATFCFEENDRGLSHFMSWNEMLNPEKGYIKDDSIILEVHVVAQTPQGLDWDSKKLTGYVGLKNEGASSYMNSLLQTLYFTNQLRKAVYKTPIANDASSKSVAVALQGIFHALQFSDQPVSTKKLTDSLSKETLDALQHDQQEFLRVLLDDLENKMRGTCVEGTIPKLFEGKMKSYIKCRNVDYTSTTEETYYDIQLNIKEKNNIIESFQDYVKVEALDGDNKYDAGEHGLQVADKGVIFSTFPPVLRLHLMRFQYDPYVDCSVKLNDRFEFTEKLSLNAYLEEAETTPANYTLHTVLVHSGDYPGGHYAVFINTRRDGKWYKFDGDVVSSSTKKEAINHNFGGPEHSTNACMLVYIRDSELENVLQEVTQDDIPQELVERLEGKSPEQIRRDEQTKANGHMSIKILLEDNFENHQGTGLFDPENAKYRSFLIRKDTILRDFLGNLSKILKRSVNQIRPWPLKCSRHETCRPDMIDMEHDLLKPVAELSENQNPWSIFLEVVPPNSGLTALPWYDKHEEVVLFFKRYDPKLEKIFYCGHHYALITQTLDSLVPLLNDRAGFLLDTELYIYEETKAGLLKRLDDYDVPLTQVLEQPKDGDIIIFQRKESPAVEAQFKLKTPEEYFRARNLSSD